MGALAVGMSIVAVALIHSFRSAPVDSAPLAVAAQVAPRTAHAAIAPPPPRAEAKALASVYECETNGRHIFSDRPCQGNGRSRTILAPNSMAAQDTSILYQPLSSPEMRATRVGEEAVADRSGECAAIEREQDAINAHMQAGYSAAEGEWLRARLRGLSDRYYQLRCHHSR